MLYKCSRCKAVKFFAHPAPTETAYCVVCQCSRLFSADTSSSTSTHLPSRSTRPRSTMIRAFGGSISSLDKSTDHSDVGKHRSHREPMTSSTTRLVRSSSMTTFQPCNYFKLCLEYMLSLGYSKKLFNRKHNRCYCETCYPTSDKDFYIKGGYKYVIPRGYVRFGLYVDDAQAEAENIWNKWLVSYHGTSTQAAKSILEHHQFLLPGDQCIGGNVIRIREGHIPNKFQVYTSPTIAYSGNDIYSPSNSFYSTFTGKSYTTKVVLQCRQKPGTVRIQAETIGAGNKRICPIIPNSEVEYFTEVRSSIVPYGLLIRVF